MIDFPMALAADEPVTVVAQVLADVLGVPRGDALAVGALGAVVRTLDHPLTVETYDELLGRPATARVLFSVENKTDGESYREGRRRLATVAAELAVRLDAEACLTFQLDRVVMRRTGGELRLFAWFPEWSEPAVLGALRGPIAVTDEAGHL
ncbi:SitI3 family protein [Cellulomonas sp. 179-A 4D5 NHS]|uniref:SitI3 family protein n=1 Tax=Cellulomonas sp. 179-A 4D5 NHS TaxID=3142378 RepID=UPI00399F7662